MLCLLAFSASGAVHKIEHQYGPLHKAKVEVKDFSFLRLEGRPLSLREVAQGGRVVLITYFAAWCHNSNYDVETINELYAKYKDQGFAVIGVCEYSDAEELKRFVAEHKPTYPICLEGGHDTPREETSHFKYRRKTGDLRQWGTPFNLLVRAEDIKTKGDTFTKNVHAAAGELIKAEAEEFIRKQLQLAPAKPTIQDSSH